MGYDAVSMKGKEIRVAFTLQSSPDTCAMPWQAYPLQASSKWLG